MKKLLTNSFDLLYNIIGAPGSSNGRTNGFDPFNRGSNPCPGSINLIILCLDYCNSKRISEKKLFLYRHYACFFFLFAQENI